MTLLSPYTTDKVSNGYLPTYQELAVELDQPCPVLEIGCGDGAGMAMFADLFGGEVAGVDIEPIRSGLPGVTIIDQMSTELPRKLPGPWGLIADDASHLPLQTSVTLGHMWPTVRPGGAYVIEDWNFFDGEGMASVLWQQLFGKAIRYRYVLNGLHGNRYSGELSSIESVTVRHGLIVIRKTK